MNGIRISYSFRKRQFDIITVLLCCNIGWCRYPLKFWSDDNTFTKYECGLLHRLLFFCMGSWHNILSIIHHQWEDYVWYNSRSIKPLFFTLFSHWCRNRSNIILCKSIKVSQPFKGMTIMLHKTFGVNGCVQSNKRHEI